MSDYVERSYVRCIVPQSTVMRVGLEPYSETQKMECSKFKIKGEITTV